MIQILVCLLTLGVAQAQLSTKSIVYSEKNPAQIFNFDKYDQRPKSYPQSALYNIKKAYFNNRPQTCLDLILKHQKKMPGLLPWIYNQQIECGMKLSSRNIKNKSTLNRIFKRGKSSQKWFVDGPYSEALLKNYIKMGLKVMGHQLRTNRARAWKTFADLEVYYKKMSKQQKAQIYQLAGELSFVQQRLSLAKSFYLRSLDYVDSRKVKEKLSALDINFTAKKSENKEMSYEDLTVSEEEKKVLARMKRSLQSDDAVAIAEDAVQIIINYPAGRNAYWANNIIRRLYYRLAKKSDAKLALLKSKIREIVSVLDGNRLLKWAEKYYARGLYSDSFWFANTAFEKLTGNESSIKALSVAAQSLYAQGNYSGAVEKFQTVVIKASGTRDMVSSLFYIGTLNFRQKKYSESAAAFEKLIALPEKYNYELSSMYWLWRAKQKIIGGDQKEYAKKIYEKYPITYYGLRAYGETHNNELKWIDLKPLRKKVSLKFTQRELLAFQRFELLAGSGWSKEAQDELKVLVRSKSIDENLVYAQLWAKAGGYLKAMILTEKVFSEDLNYIKWNVVKNVYPEAFKELIKKYSLQYGLQPYWVMSLMRQESSFDSKAVSSSNARGLMQLVRITANEMSRRLKLKNYRFPESLDEPKVNIRMGSAYLKRMVRANNGYLPLALACYNAGIGNIRKWMRSRKDLVDLKNTKSSDPEAELWVDELPWSETRFYIKAIMRNYLIYNLLSKGQVELKDPLWNL